MTTFDLTSVTTSHNSSTAQLTASSSINSGSTYHLLDSDTEKLIKSSSVSAASANTTTASLSTGTTSTASLSTIVAAVCGSMNSWFRHYRIYKTILLILLLLVLLPLFAHRSLLNVSNKIMILRGILLKFTCF